MHRLDKFSTYFLEEQGSQISPTNQPLVPRQRITLTNNEIKGIEKVIRFLENRRSLLKGTTGNIISQERRILNYLGPLMRVGLPLMKNVLTTLAKSVLISLGFTAVASATNAAIQKKLCFGLVMTALIISNNEMDDIIKIVRSLEESGLLIKGVNKAIKNKANNKMVDFLACY